MKDINKKFSGIHRLVHWAIAFVISISFITGFLHEFWMSKHNIADKITSGLQSTQLSKEQVIKAAESIREPMWQWHVYVAYVMVVLIAARIIYMFVKGIKFPIPFKKELPVKERLEGITIFLFYLFIVVNVITGFYHLLGSDPQLKHLSGTIHKWAIYWFPLFILFHFAGIFFAEISNKKGIASRMIGGD